MLKKRIVFVLTQSLDSPSGLGRYGPMARGLCKLGYGVELLALHPAWHTLSKTTFEDEGVRVDYVSQMHVQKNGSEKQYYSPLGLLKVGIEATIRLARALKRSSADIIHLGKPQPFNSLAVRFASQGRPIFCDCDDYEFATNRFSQKWQKTVVRYFEDGIIDLADELTVNTQFTAKRYERLGFPPDKITYIPNAVERARFQQNDSNELERVRQSLMLGQETPVVIYVGTMGLTSHPVDLLLKGFAEVVKTIPHAKLVLVGGGEDYSLLQQMAINLGIHQHTVFVGRVSPPLIPHYLSLASVSADPIHDDLVARARSPLKLFESLAQGVPVITSDVGDRSLILEHEVTGYFVEAGKHQALAQGIIHLLQNTPLLDKMRQNIASNNQIWYWDKFIPHLAQRYDRY